MKIANKINFAFFIVVVLLMGISMLIFYTAAKTDLQKAIFDHLSTTAHSRANHIETFLEANKEATTQLSKSIVIEEFLLASEQDEDYDQKFNNALRRLEATTQVRKHIHEIFILSTDGEIAASSDKSKIGLDRSSDIYFLGAKKGPFIKDAYYSETTGKKALAFSAPIKNSKTGELLGVIVARLNLNTLNEIVTDKTGLGKTGEIYLVNKYGYMITPSLFVKDTFLKLKVDTENARKCLEDVQKFGSKPHPHEPLVYIDYRGVKVLGTHSHIHEMRWGIFAEIDEEEALGPLAAIKLVFIILFCATVGAVWMVGTLVSRAITAPIHKLHRGTELIGDGNLDYKVGTDAKDEIGRLSRTFDEMTHKLKESYAQLKESQIQLEERVKERTAELSSANAKLEGEVEQRSSAKNILEERIKELNCLFGLSKLVERPEISLEQIFEETASLIRKAYQEPDKTCVRVTFEGVQYKTDNFAKSESSQHAEIKLRGEKAGDIEVYYLGEKPESSQSAFLKEESDLLDAVAKHLGSVAERTHTREKLQLFRDLIDRSNDCVFVTEPKWGRFLDLNDKACNSLGYTREELLGMSIKDIEETIPDDSAWTEHVKEVREKGYMIFESVHKRKDGTAFPVEINIKFIEQEKDSYILAVARDITERKKAEQRQDELVEQVESINKELKDFAYIVSHDLKAPLRGVKTLADWITTDYADKLDDQGKEQMGLLSARVDRMHNLIDGVLQYSRVGREKEKRVQVNLNDLVSGIIDAIAPPENIAITVDDELPVVKCGQTRIMQVFQNLLSNAVKYMDKPKGKIKVGCVEENGFWKFSIADNGPGIEEKNFERIFKIFQTLSPRDEVESTGVGLTVVKKIVEIYGGKIWVESKSGQGSTFFFTLPKQKMGVKNAKLKTNIAR